MKRFKLGHRWPVIVGVAAFVIVTVTRSDFGVDGSARNYLLSTISQSLAAVFALAFTITLVASQFAAKYSLAAVSDFFDADTIVHGTLFMAAIIFPLFLLRSPTTPRGNLGTLPGLQASD